jgi:ProP effector
MEQIPAPQANGKPPGHSSDLLATLQDLFPAAFNERPKPLKLGIHNDIIERLGPVSYPELRGAFRFYTGSLRYLRTLKPDALRIDLDGNAAGTVTEQEAAHAQETIAGIQMKLWKRAWEKRRAFRIEREQRHRAAQPQPPQPAASSSPAAQSARLALADLKSAWRARQSGSQP